MTGITSGPSRRLPGEQRDNLDELVERIAEAVVVKLEERRKIDAIADAVLARLEGQERAGDEGGPAGKSGKESAGSKPRQGKRAIGKLGN